MLFVLHLRSRYCAAWQANRQISTEAEYPVVPTFAGLDEGKFSEVGLLLLQQRADESDINRHFRGRRHRRSLHSGQLS